MSEPVELGFRQRLAAAFATELEGRVYELVAPPEAKLPLATYRRMSTVDDGGGMKAARITLTLVDDEYAAVKRLQEQIERYLAGLRATWLSSGSAGDCPVWVFMIKPSTQADGYQGATRRRVAVSDIEIRYADG